jgi:release factor glutamine methyltransferase
MTICEALAEGSGTLAAAGIETPGLDASLLLAEILNISRSSLLAAGSDTLAEESFAAFNDMLKRRLAGECTAYIIGKKEFYGLEFAVNPLVLVPRPETELLVETAIQLAMSNEQLAMRNGNRESTEMIQQVRVLDLCTGSGAVAIALKHEMPELEVWATDISEEALAVAAANAARLLPPDSIHFCQGDLYDAISPLLIAHCSLLTDQPHSPLPTPYSLVLSNPPYIPTADIPSLSPEVRREPILALDGGLDGLYLIRRIISSAPLYLGPGGVLLLEADPRQMLIISALLDQTGFIDVQIHKDLSGKERVIGGRKP